jgi:hypothetical protein
MLVLKFRMTRTIGKFGSTTVPIWIVIPIVAGLFAFSGVIVAIGWWFAAPLRTPAPTLSQGAQAPAEVVPVPKPAAPQPSPEKSPEAEIPQTPRTKIALPRRIVVRRDEAPPELLGEPMQGHTQVKPAPKSEMKWMLEKLAPEKNGKPSNLMLPIEVAKMADAPIPYNVRRLSLPGEAPKPLKLAITPYVHDDIARLLHELGQGQRCVNIPKLNLQSMEILKLYDVVFLTCAELYLQDFQATAYLRKYVERGGTLYASDLQYARIVRAFPEYEAKQPALPGIQQDVEAIVTDKGLEAYLGYKKIPLSFDAPDWRAASFDPAKVTVCLTGAYRNGLGKTETAPLLVKFRHGEGTVIFTSFHHSRNETPTVRKMLEYLALAPLNARNEARIHEMMRLSNFTPDDLRPLLLHAGQAERHTHHHAGGGMQIALGFEHVGAKIKLTLRAPNGSLIEHEGHGLYLIEIPEAERGDWQCTITPIELPQRSLPMINAIGRMKS